MLEPDLHVDRSIGSPSAPVWCVTSRVPSMRFRALLDLGDDLRELHAAGLAATAGVDLRLDDPEAAAELLGGGLGLGGGLQRRRRAGTGMPYSAKMFLDWYSCRFIANLCLSRMRRKAPYSPRKALRLAKGVAHAADPSDTRRVRETSASSSAADASRSEPRQAVAQQQTRRVAEHQRISPGAC